STCRTACTFRVWSPTAAIGFSAAEEKAERSESYAGRDSDNSDITRLRFNWYSHCEALGAEPPMRSKPRLAIYTLNGLVATLLLVSAAAAQSTGRTSSQLTSVLVQPANGSVRVIFRLTRPARYTSTRTADPSRIVIELLQTRISPVFTRREISSTHASLSRVVISRSSASTRAVLVLNSAGTHAVYAVGSDLIVDIKTKTPA